MADATGNDGAYMLPVTLAPMEAKTAVSLPLDGNWQFEPKWDGFRCMIFKNGTRVDLRAKSGKPLGRYFPEVVAFFAGLSVDRFVIDGELVVEVDGHLAFDALQMRLHPAGSRIQKLSRTTPARFVLFDILATPDGVVVTDRPFAERRRMLEDFCRSHDLKPLVELSPMTRSLAQAQQWLADSGPNGTDGVVAKDLDMPYLSGERAMLKVKRLRTADCVVGGFRYQSEGSYVGSLLLGLFNPRGELDHVGFTSTISDEERPDLTRKLEALREPPGFTGKAPGGPSRWSSERSTEWTPLRPELVVEVRYDHVTGKRFRHGTKLMRWRPDKRPDQCTYDQIV